MTCSRAGAPRCPAREAGVLRHAAIPQQPRAGAGAARGSGVGAAAARFAGRLRRFVRDAAAAPIPRAGPPQHPLRLRRAGADAGLRQHQLHVVGGLDVAGDGRGDRARLLVAGQQQEGRRAAIALDADRVEARLRMESSRWPCGGTEPQECSFGSISGPSALTLSSQGSSSSRSSRVSSRSGRWPVATMMRSTGPIRRTPSRRIALDDDAGRHRSARPWRGSR